MTKWRLYAFVRSSASWRVRIALALKGCPAQIVPCNTQNGEQRTPAYRAVNPQGLVPALDLGDGTPTLTQSLAICEWLNESIPEPPLLPNDALARARVRAFALAIACEIHPLQNSGVLRRLSRLGLDQQAGQLWARETIADGLAACLALLPAAEGEFCFGGQVTLADVVLVPQMANARHYGVDLAPLARLVEIEAKCLELPAFRETAPATQPDASNAR